MLVFQIFRYSCQTSQGTSETTCCYWEFEIVYSSLSLLLSNRIKTLDEGKDLLRLCNKYYSNHKNAVTTSTSIFLCSSTRQSLSFNRYLPFQSWGNESTLWSNWMYVLSSLFYNLVIINERIPIGYRNAQNYIVSFTSLCLILIEETQWQSEFFLIHLYALYSSLTTL